MQLCHLFLLFPLIAAQSGSEAECAGGTASTLAMPSFQTACQMVKDKLEIHYGFDGILITLCIKGETNGWIGFGPAKSNAKMDDAMVGSISAISSSGADDEKVYRMEAKVQPSTPAAADVVTSIMSSVTDGSRMLCFQLSKDHLNGKDGDTLTAANFVFAYGGTDQESLTYHGTNRGLIALNLESSKANPKCEGGETDGCGPVSTTSTTTTAGSPTGGGATSLPPTTVTTTTTCKKDKDDYCIPGYGAANDFVTNKSQEGGQCNTIQECNGGLDCYTGVDQTKKCDKATSSDGCTCQKIPCTSTGSECTGKLECRRQEADETNDCAASDEECFCKLSFQCEGSMKKESCEACGTASACGGDCVEKDGKCTFASGGANPVATIFFAMIFLLS